MSLRFNWARAAGAIAVSLATLVVAARALAQPNEVGEWGPVLDWGVQAKHAALLPTGDVLVWATGSDARVWDADTAASFKAVPFPAGDLHCAGQATLADGTLVVIGGQHGNIHIGITVTGLFNPFTGGWLRGKDMNFARWYGTATTLGDGRLLASSGDDHDQQRVTIPEIYDPQTDTWTALPGADRQQPLYPLTFQLPDGRVFEAGPEKGTWLLDTTGDGSWLPGPHNAFGSSGYAESDVMYDIGKILRAGGGDPAFADCAVIDMTAASPEWHAVSPMAFPRRRHGLVILANGEVLATGGTRRADEESEAVLQAEIWNPATEQWRTVAAMNEARMYHSTALLLPDGRVVTGGGEAAGRLHAQIYSPPYLFQGSRPEIVSAPAVIAYAGEFVVTTPDAPSIASVAILRSGAATHTFDHNQRYVPLEFERSGNDLTVHAPAGGNVAPPGYYMLIIQSSTGVPSPATWVRLGSTSTALGAITGTVIEAASGDPIAGATVSFAEGSTPTDIEGKYTLANIRAGQYQVSVSATGYATAVLVQHVSAGQTATVNFALVSPGTVSGRVTDAQTGEAVAGANVSHDSDATLTDDAGNYTLTGIPSGTCAVVAAAVGYVSEGKNANVPANGNIVLDFALTAHRTAIDGEVWDADRQQPIAGATVCYSGGCVTTDALGFYALLEVAPGAYSVTASADGYAGRTAQVLVDSGLDTTMDFFLQPLGTTTATFAPSGDAKVNQGSPKTNYGDAENLRVRESATSAYTSYLKFDLSSVSTGIQAAKLRLYVTEASEDGGNVYLVDNDWNENDIDWDSRPSISGTSTPIGPVDDGEWVEADVTWAVTGAGVYSFGLKNESTDSAYYSSREGTWPPELVLTLNTQVPEPPVADFTGAPLSGDAPLTVSFTDRSSGNPSQWTWDFGDGASSNVRDPSHVYEQPGNYNVSLQAKNAQGSNTAAKTSYVIVTESGGPATAVRYEETEIGGSSAETSVATDAFIDAAAGALYLAAISTKPAVGVDSVAGLGLEWSELRTQCAGRDQTGVSLWMAKGDATSDGIVTAQLADAPVNTVIAVSRYSGAAPAHPIGAIISGNSNGVAGACSGGVDGNSYALDIPVTHPGAVVYGAVAIRNRSHTPGAVYHEQLETHHGSPNPAGVAVQDRAVDQETSVRVDGTFSNTLDWALVAVEIAPAPESPTSTTTTSTTSTSLNTPTTTLASPTTTTGAPTTTIAGSTTTTVQTSTTTPDEATTTTVAVPTTVAAGTTTTLPELALCGDFSGDRAITASDALGVLRAVVGSVPCALCICDVDASSVIAASDALAVLRAALGLGTVRNCSSCEP